MSQQIAGTRRIAGTVAAPVRVLHYGDEQILIQGVPYSGNGWYYDYNGDPLGRGGPGLSNARNYLAQKVLDALAEHGRPTKVEPEYLPSAATASRSYYSSNNAGLWTQVSTGIGNLSIEYLPDRKILQLDVPPIIAMLNQTPIQPGYETASLGDVPFKSIIDNFWSTVVGFFPQLKVIEDLLPTESIVPYLQPTGAQAKNSIPTPWGVMVCSPTVFFKYRGEAELKKVDALGTVAEAFRALGHTVMTTNVTWGDDSHVTQVVVDAKLNHGDETLPHTITFTYNGSEISCGYVEDEKKFLEYQRREVIGWAQDEFTPVTFE